MTTQSSTSAVPNPTRYATETGKRLPRRREGIGKYFGKKDVYVHYSDIPRMGLYLGTTHDDKGLTPSGFYVYPFAEGKVGKFATSRPYALIVRPKVGARLLRLNTYTAAQFREDYAALKRRYPKRMTKARLESWAETNYRFLTPYSSDDPPPRFPKRSLAAWNTDRERQRAGRAIWTLTEHLADGRSKAWTVMFFKTLGYDGVVDDCQRIIWHHGHGEDCQAVFFNTTAVDLLDIIDNQKGKAHSYAGADFTDMEILPRYPDISDAEEDYRGAKFVGTTLVRAKLRGLDLRGADFTGADLRGADLRESDLRYAKFARAVVNTRTRFPAGFDRARLKPLRRKTS